jgi:protoporphyrinogen oxidase
MSKISFAIVGGGILGMTLAHLLIKRGHLVNLFEAECHPGGLARSWDLCGFPASRFYHVILWQDMHHRALLRELECEERIHWVKTRTGFFIDGKVYSLSSIPEFLMFPPLGFVDKLRLSMTILSASRLESTAHLSALEWLKRTSGSRVTERIWIPLLRAKFGNKYHQVSAAYMKAVIRRMFKARRGASGEEMFGYIPGGYGPVLDHFTAFLTSSGVGFHTEHCVRSLERIQKGFRIMCGDGHSHEAEQVILTIPLPLARNVCTGLCGADCSFPGRSSFIGIVCASLLISRQPGDFYILNIADEQVPFTAIINMTVLAPRSDYGGYSLIYLPKYVTSEDPLLGHSDEQIKSLFLPALEKMYPAITQDIRCFKVAREKYVLPMTSIDCGDQRPGLSTDVPGLFISSAAHIIDRPHTIDEVIRLANDVLLEIEKGQRE